VIGNWKMNPSTIGQAKKLFLEVRKQVSRKLLHTYVAIAPPFPYLSELERLSPSQRIKLVAQDMYHEKAGAFTGEISTSMLQSVGVEAVIIGHSERRALGDTLEKIKNNVMAALAAKLTVVLCVGEMNRDPQANYFSVIEEQLRTALKEVPKSQLKRLVIAYEPVWAIGTGKNATPEDVQEMRLFITKVLADRFGRPAINTIRIMYGGSVNAQNADALMSVGQVDGFLVGGASLKAAEFLSIIKTAEAYA
jgi:triosephosphate isomerase (TIM)